MRLICFIFAIMMFMLPEAFGQVEKPARDGHREAKTYSRYDKEGEPFPEGITAFYTRITVTPSALPDPLLRYRLNVMSTEKEPGNAAPLYVEALAELEKVRGRKMENLYKTEAYRKLDPDKDWEAIMKLKFKAFPLYPYWNSDHYVEITPQEEQDLYESTSDVYRLLEKASRKRYYDWNDSFEFKGIATMLPHIQDSRTLARYLGGKADWEIRCGKYDEAVKTIRLGLALGEHIRESSPFNVLVTQLVGIAITGIFQAQIEHIVAQPDAPNLYPALTQLYIRPDSMLQSVYAEQVWLFSSMKAPGIIETINEATPEESKNVLEDLLSTFIFGVEDQNFAGFLGTEQGRSLALSVTCLMGYPHGKDRLLEQGLSETEIDALSTYQIVAPMILEEIKRVYDLLFVSMAFPPGESHTAIVFDENQLRDVTSPAKVILSLMLPATEAAKMAFLRQQQAYDRLKIIEAIRFYASVHDGKLPESLEDIKEIPVPKIDVATGKPFGYRVEGDKALLDYTMYGSCRLEITVEQTDRRVEEQ